MRKRLVLLAAIAALLVPSAALAQQTGSIAGKVTATDGSLLPGVTVEARSDVLPGPRMVVTGPTGEYRMPALPPGNYTIRFSLSGMQTVTRQAQIQLAQEVALSVSLGVQTVKEEVTVRSETTLVDKDSGAIKSTLSSDLFRSLPVGQDYRDLIKFIPGVQYTQDGTRGPSAGGSGQDNVYLFDGVNVTLPLFGTLSAEPASHDIAQITTIKGGAKAINFERSGGFAVDSVSRSGTNRVSGQISYQILNHNMWAKLNSGSLSKYEQDRSWWDLNFGGPLMKDKIFFYASYYRPAFTRDNRANLYGELPDYKSTRNEGFGKVTLRPASELLLNVSFRDSHRFERSDLFGPASKDTTGTGNEAWLRIGTAEGSWIIDSKSYVTFKYTDFTNRTQGRPDNIANPSISTAVGTRIDINNLDTLGLFVVPSIIANQTAYNAFVQPIIDRYGYISNGARVGGGNVGFGSTFDKDDFFRNGGQIGYNYTIGTHIQHELHVGYQRYTDSEDLTRRSNGWGVLSVPGGRTSFQGTPIFFLASFQQQSLEQRIPTIHSEYQSQSIELNDTIRWRDWSFNAGVLLSNDTLFGQGLVEDSTTLSGYRLPPATATTTKARRYKMYEIPFSKMVQPRLGATWAYDGKNTVYFSYAKYNPAASSLPRAASWDRNLATTIEAYFDATGTLFGSQNVASSSGKLFVPDMTPRTVVEYVYGTAREFSPHLTGRIYGRYREGSHFWEDTNNNARVAFNPTNATVNGVTVPAELYIPDLPQRLAQIGSGSTYVIAELDGAYTKFYETTFESEYRTGKVFLRGSYTWSHYYGNFDQDNTTTGNDANIFIGSSFIADGAGRQLWDFRDGDLRGDRRHMFKAYGFYTLDFMVGKYRWDATVGAFLVAQSGQPWEMWSYEPYRALTTSVSDVSRFAEPAGSRRSPAHAQVDLNYTQNFKLKDRVRAQVALDLFNVGNKQTGYNFQSAVHAATFGQPRNYFDPRRFQIAMRLLF